MGMSPSKSNIPTSSNYEVIMPDRKIVKDAFKVTIDRMEFREEEHHDWDRFSKEFVFNVDENQRI